MTALPEMIRKNAARLGEALCGYASRFVRPDLAVADQAAGGIINFNHMGAVPIEVGRHDLDWAGGHRRHQEWCAQLNRFFFLSPLAAAYAETKDEKYAEAARDYLADWLRARPTRDGWEPGPGDNTLTLGIRNDMWFANLPAFLDSPAFDEAFIQQMIDSTAVQLAYLMGHLAPYMNWRIAHADSLLMTGLRLEFHPHAATWRDKGVRVLNDAFHRQVRPDGAHDEVNPSYHGWMTRVYSKYWQLNKSMPELGMCMTAEVIAGMYDYSLAMTRPNGTLNAMHDCTGKHSGPRPENWDKARRQFRRDAGLPDEMPPTSHFFPDAGQAAFRDSWAEDAVYLTFDASIWGGAHCHLSRNAIQLHAYGRSLLIDPGTLTYETSDPMSAHGKSTRAHNTLTLDGGNQSNANPVTHYRQADGYDMVDSLYDGGYWPGPYTWSFYEGHGPGIWGEHHRILLWIHARAAIVIDHFSLDSADTKTIECNWQLSPGPVTLEPDKWRAFTGHDDANLLMLFAIQPESAKLSCYEGETDPPRGWVPGANEYAPAPQLCVETAPGNPKMSGRHFVTVLIPYRGSQRPEVAVSQTVCPEPAGYGKLALEWADGHTDSIWWTGRLFKSLDDCDGLETDASLIHLHKDAEGSLVKGLIVDGTYLRPYVTEPKSTAQTFTITSVLRRQAHS